MKKYTIPLFLFAIVFSFGFNDAFAQSDESQSTREPFIRTDLDSFTPNMDIILFGNVGGLDIPITVEVSCDDIPDSTTYIRIFSGDDESFQIDESGYFRTSLRTLGFTCNMPISTVTAAIQGTSASTSFEIIQIDENTQSTISASTDKASYQKGDDVIFSGKVINYEFGKVISYVLDDPNGYHISTSQSLLPNSDGTFSHNFGSDDLFRLNGDYEISYTYADDSNTKSKFTFHYSIPAEPIPESTVESTSEPTDTLETDESEIVSEDDVEYDEVVSQLIDESFEIQSDDMESTSEISVTNEESYSTDSIVADNLVQQDKKLDSDSKLDVATQSKVKSFDGKISREQSQYDEYLKQYDYYEGKTLSSSDEIKFQNIVEKLNSQNEKIDSLIDERNMVVSESNTVEIVEEKIETPQPVKFEEKPEKEMTCFLFWCW